MCYIIRDRRPATPGTASVPVVMVVMLVTGVTSGHGRVLAVIRVQSRLNIRNAASPDAADFRAIVIGAVIGPRRDFHYEDACINLYEQISNECVRIEI